MPNCDIPAHTFRFGLGGGGFGHGTHPAPFRVIVVRFGSHLVLILEMWFDIRVFIFSVMRL